MTCVNNEVKYENRLLYEKTELSGCNIKTALRNDDSETPNNNNDTINIIVTREFAHVFVGINYTCKTTAFTTESKTIDDVLFMYIIDGGEGYERCTCYYTFDFIFKRKSAKTLNQKYKIVLIDPRKEEFVLISEGVISDNK